MGAWAPAHAASWYLTLLCLLSLLRPHAAIPLPALRASIRTFDTGAPGQATQKAAVFTPYYITPGGGEKYLLSTVQAMQSMGYYVDILVQPDNICQAQQCVMDVAGSLRVKLDPDMLAVHVVHKEGHRIFAGPYSVFFSLGNNKHPDVAAIGAVNLFMCQFPFDLAWPVSPAAMDVFSTYDAVLLNSRYSLHWYHSFAAPMYQYLMNSAQKLFPRTQILHPPVTLLKPAAPSASHPKHIVMLGRFFAGRQSKGHPYAIEMFAKLVPELPKDTLLIMAGNAMPGQHEYIAELTKTVQSLKLGHRIQIELSKPAARIMEILQSGLVQWHLTGLGTHDDPASLEHFGISIVEGMSAGTIPVAYQGGAADIIHHGHEGFVAGSVEQIMAYTKQVFHMGEAEQAAMQSRCREKAQEFEYERFERRFHKLVHVTEMMKPSKPVPTGLLSSWRAVDVAEAV